jgi:hypothetical protein
MSRARIRTIKPEMLEDEKLGRLSRDARLLFVALITMADDDGRMRASGAYIRGQRYPYDEDVTPSMVDRWLGELAAGGIVQVYDTSGQRYAQIVNWTRHQKVNRPSASKVPGPEGAIHVIPGACSEFSEASLNTHGGLTEASLRPQNISVLIPPTSDRHTTDRGPPTSPQPPADGGLGVLGEAEGSALKASATPAAIVAAWNDSVGESGVKVLRATSRQTEARDGKIRKAAERFPDVESWRWCARALAGSSHHRGENSTGWRASLEWLLERGNGAKLEEWMANGDRLRRGEVDPAPPPPRRPMSIGEHQLAESAAVVDHLRARARASPPPETLPLLIDTRIHDRPEDR